MGKMRKVPSLKPTAKAPLKIGKIPKGWPNLPFPSHFSGAFAVSFREGIYHKYTTGMLS